MNKTTRLFKKRALSCLILLALLLGVPNIAYSQNLTLNHKNQELSIILKDIQSKSDYKFAYNSALINVKQLVSIDMKNANINSILSKLFANTDISYKIAKKQIMLLNKNSKVKTITGKIADSKSKEPVLGAVIQIKGTRTYVISDTNGEYTLEAPANSTLIISSLGMKEIEVNTGDRIRVNLELESDFLALDDVVVTGFQTLSKERATGSFAMVTSEDLDKYSSTNISSKLAATMNGVHVDRSGNIEIRGQSTLNTDDGKASPLVVVDGFPIEGGLSSINPNDIESITILKDAAAASIYGIKSANGVIVVNRKSSSKERLSINADVNYSLSQVPDLGYFNKSSSADAAAFLWESLENGYMSNILPRETTSFNEVQRAYIIHQEGDVAGAKAIMDKINTFGDLATQQYQENLFQRQTLGQYGISISGGQKNAEYYVSGRVEDNISSTKGNKSTKFFLDTRLKLKITDKLTLNLATTNNYGSSESNSPISRYTFARGISPFEPLIVDNELYPEGDNSVGFRIRDKAKELGLLPAAIEYNPINELNARDNTTLTSYSRYQAGLNYKFDFGLKIDLKYQFEDGDSKYTSIESPQTLSQAKLINSLAQGDTPETLVYNLDRSKSGLSRTLTDWQSHIARAVLDYDKTINEKHYLSGIAGIEVQTTETQRVHESYAQYDPITGATIPEFVNTVSKIKNWAGDNKSITPSDYFKFENSTGYQRFFSTFFNLGYSFDNKYNLTGSFRIDQSNIFGTSTENRYKPMWSIGASWNIKNEKFLADINWLSNLSLRATYGLTGMIDKSTSPYVIIQKEIDDWMGEYAAFPNAPNKNLKWEQTKNLNIGIDYSIFNNRLSGYIDYYNKYTTDVIAPTISDPTNGFGQITANTAEISNKGIDLNINSLNIDRDFKWMTTLNFSINKNKIEKLYVSQGLDSQYYVAGTYTGQQYAEGHPIGQLYSYNWAGLDNTGAATIYNKDGEIVNASDNPSLYQEDLIYEGTTQAPYFGNFINTFSWKGLNLSFSITYKLGHLTRGDRIDSSGYNDYYTKIYNQRWRKPGDELITDIPGFADVDDYNSKLWYTYGSVNTIDASNIRLQFLSLSYELPQRALKKIGLKGLRFSFQGENLGIIWRANKLGIDPEVHSTEGTRYYLPNTPTYTFGINIKL